MSKDFINRCVLSICLNNSMDPASLTLSSKWFHNLGLRPQVNVHRTKLSLKVEEWRGDGHACAYMCVCMPVCMCACICIQADVVVSVEALVFIVIGRSCSEGCGFDSHYRPGSFLRFNYRPIMYGAVGSLVSSRVLSPSTWVKFPLEHLNLIV